MIRSNIMLVPLMVWSMSCQQQQQPADKGYDVPHALHVAIEGLREPNQYQVVIKWDEPRLERNWILYRKESDDIPVPLHKEADPACSYIDSSVISGKNYRYLLKSTDSEAISLEAGPVSIPVDLVIDGATEITRAKVNRLFFRKGAHINSKGTPISFEVNEIVSEDATIDMSPVRRVMSPGTDGNSCGPITIKAIQASGNLELICNAENGSDGTDGHNGSDGTVGTCGNPGDWGMNPELYKCLVHDFVDSVERQMRRYPRPPGHPEWNFTLAGLQRFICSRPPANGGPGGPGIVGKDGGPGGNGGNAASIFVSVENASTFELKIDNNPGRAGLGGRGGNGGKGGRGGPPGELDQGHLCPPAKPGPNGPDALSGRTGAPGEQGKRLPVCIRLGDKVEGDCRQFEFAR